MVVLLIVQIIVSLLLIFAVLVQANGIGVGRAFGGSSMSYHTKRGAEKALFVGTIILCFVFVGLSLLNLSQGQ
jgi:preprotein translocase subunit SecG